MSTIENHSSSPKDDWYAHWFGPRYDALYGHRSPEQAERQVQFLLKTMGPLQGRVLDLGCGAGRHLAALRKMQQKVFGLDLSAWLLSQAQKQHSPLVRASMSALPFQPSSFEAVFSFFSSFGYFPTKAEDLQILDQMLNLIQIEGFLFLDLPNKAAVVQGLYDSEHEIDGEQIFQSRRLEGDCVVKKISWHQKDGQVKTYFEKLRLFEQKEMEQILSSRNLEIIEIYGDEHGNTHSKESPRMSFLARKKC